MNTQFLTFLLAWHESEINEASVSELLPLALKSGVEFRGETDHGRLVQLGQMLRGAMGRRIPIKGGTVAVRYGHFGQGKQHYLLNFTGIQQNPTQAISNVLASATKE